jgi:putative hemolysin
MATGFQIAGALAVRPAFIGTALPQLTAREYRLRLASSEADLAALYRLRFLVFNLELNEGLEEAYLTGEDKDSFDPDFDHLMVEHAATGQVVGTYRLQTGEMAARNRGYYSAQEFAFSPYESLRGELVELGRACVHRDHRSFEVLTLLWKGIAQYARAEGARYLIGCCSLTSQDEQVGSDVYHHLRDCMAPRELCTTAIGEYAFAVRAPSGVSPKVPKLLRTYLAVGAQICSTPAIDREFKTIDFLTLMDLHQLAPSVRARLFGD